MEDGISNEVFEFSPQISTSYNGCAVPWRVISILGIISSTVGDAQWGDILNTVGVS